MRLRVRHCAPSGVHLLTPKIGLDLRGVNLPKGPAVYGYSADRCKKGPDRFLQEFSGCLQADAHAGYDAL